MRLNHRRRHYLVTAVASGLLGLFIVTVTYGPTGPGPAGDVVLGPSTTTTTASRPSPPPSLPLFTVPEQTTTSTITATVGTDVEDPAESDGPSPTVEKPRPVSVVFRPIEPGPARSDVLIPRPARFRLTPPGSTTPRRTTRPTAPQTTRPPTTTTTRPPTTTTVPPTTTTRPPTTTTSPPLPTTVPPTTITLPPTTTTSTVEPTTTVSTTTSPTTVSTTTTIGPPGPPVEIAAQEGPLS